jgi:hypothetical protein
LQRAAKGAREQLDSRAARPMLAAFAEERSRIGREGAEEAGQIRIPTRTSGLRGTSRGTDRREETPVFARVFFTSSRQ